MNSLLFIHTITHRVSDVSWTIAISKTSIIWPNPCQWLILGKESCPEKTALQSAFSKLTGEIISRLIMLSSDIASRKRFCFRWLLNNFGEVS